MAEYPTDEELDKMKAEELLKHGRFVVRDPNVARHFLRQGNCSDELYDSLVELTAKKGAMIAPFREHPEVKRILEEIKDG